MSLGTYPEVSLREARALRDGARVLLSKGVTPRLDRKQTRQAVQLADQNTFKIVYEKWPDHRGLVRKEGLQSTLSQIRRVFTKDALPMIGRRTIYELQRPDQLEIYNSPHNLPAGVCAKLSGRSRRWISYEIKAKRVLALAFGNHGHRIPDWHLDPTKHMLVQKVLSEFPKADAWGLCKALTSSEVALDGQSAVGV